MNDSKLPTAAERENFELRAKLARYENAVMPEEPDNLPLAEAKFKVGEQWYYRGNSNPQWIALASRLDGSASGIADKIPTDFWPVLNALAAALAEIERLKAERDAAFQDLGLID